MNEEDLITHLQEYFERENTRNFSVLDFVGAFGSPLLAIGYSKLFWPQFCAFEDMIFLADSIEDAEAKRRVKKCLHESWDKQEIEKSFSLCEIPEYFFNKNLGDTYDEEDEYLAEILTQMWGCKLAKDFPSRTFNVEIVPPEENGGNLAITFYQA